MPDLGPCEEWQKYRTPEGYGKVHMANPRRVCRIHRVVWENVHGPIPDGMVVMHLCDNPPCYRLSHLALGTHKENMEHMMAMGRGKPPHPPISDALISQIVISTGSARSVARKLGVDHKTVRKYRNATQGV